jgi:hypothetical protein
MPYEAPYEKYKARIDQLHCRDLLMRGSVFFSRWVHPKTQNFGSLGVDENAYQMKLLK